MQLSLIVGHIDEQAARTGVLTVLRPLEAERVRECLTGLAGLEWSDDGAAFGLPGQSRPVIVADTLRMVYSDYRARLQKSALEVAARLQRDMGCVVADHQNGRVYEAAELADLIQQAPDSP